MSAQAQAPTAIVRADDPLRPYVVLTNRSHKACSVIRDSLGTIAIRQARQGQAPLQATVRTMSSFASFETLLADKVYNLQPGQTVNIPLEVVAYQHGPALRTVTPDSQGKVTESLYPLHNERPLELVVVYKVPFAAKGTTMCDAAIGATINHATLSLQILAAISIVSLLGLLIGWIRIRQCREKLMA